MFRRNSHRFTTGVVASLIMVGCASKPMITNQRSAVQPSVDTRIIETRSVDTGSMSQLSIPPYSITSRTPETSDENILVLASFSGGGTRAAALSYGVMQGLKDTYYSRDNEQYRLLDQLSVVSSVSGGSFTSAYYGLYQDKLFTHYEEEFLYKNISLSLISILTSPTYLFSGTDRSAAAAKFYNDNLFSQSTFSDIPDDGPMILINATDVGGAVRFSFVQEYFDLLCSDINQYSVASAVAASSAVPFIFTPVLLQNYDDCDATFNAQQWSTHSTLSHTTTEGLSSYADKESRPFIHLIDGGITDNIGLMALYDIFESNNKTFNQRLAHIDQVVVISVDASTEPDWKIDDSPKSPSARNLIGAVTDVQLHRYNDMSKMLIEDRLRQWEEEVTGRSAYFVDINLSTSEQSDFMNQIPTDFNLEDNQVDALIAHGYGQILHHPTLAEALKSD